MMCLRWTVDNPAAPLTAELINASRMCLAFLPLLEIVHAVSCVSFLCSDRAPTGPQRGNAFATQEDVCMFGSCSDSKSRHSEFENMTGWVSGMTVVLSLFPFCSRCILGTQIHVFTFNDSLQPSISSTALGIYKVGLNPACRTGSDASVNGFVCETAGST